MISSLAPFSVQNFMKLECKTWEKTSFRAERERHVVHNDEQLEEIYRGVVESSRTFRDIEEDLAWRIFPRAIFVDDYCV